ncbi:MAG: TspO/MBR family protein [Patescibacteria group bacterium]
MLSKQIKFIVSLVLPLAAGFIGSFFTTPAINSWYATLIRPSFSPPNWIFGPVWTLLYILMGVSLFIVWKSDSDKNKKRVAMVVFFGHLVLNTLWSIIFFGLNNPFFAFIEIIILWLSILVTAFLFFRIKKIAGILFIPYLLWVSFASVLNFSIWQLNRIPQEIIPVTHGVVKDFEKCEIATGIKIGDEVSWQGKVYFNAMDGSWYVIERIPKDEKHPYAYIHWKDKRGEQYSGTVLVNGTVTGFDPDNRKVFFYNYPCLPDIEIYTLTQD